MERQAKNYNKVVNFDKETKEITVLRELFEYKDSFKGAVGSIFEPISKAYYDEVMEKYLNNPQAVSEYWNDNIGEPLTYNEYEAIANDEDDVIRLCGGLDDSYSEMWDELREVTELTEDEAYMFNCIGGGRCFTKDFQGNFNKELSKLIREYES